MQLGGDIILEHLQRTASSLYGAEFGLLQFSHRAWTDVLRRDCLRTVIGSFVYCPFGAENWLYSVELIEAGETVDSTANDRQ